MLSLLELHAGPRQHRGDAGDAGDAGDGGEAEAEGRGEGGGGEGEDPRLLALRGRALSDLGEHGAAIGELARVAASLCFLRCALSDLGEHGAAAALLQPLHDTCFEQLVPTGSKRGKGKRAVAGAQAASRAEEEEEGGRSSAPKRPRLAVSPPAASPPRCGQDEAAAPTAAPPAASVFRQGSHPAEVLPAATAPGRETAGVAGSA